jgi:hypothetical protein
LFFKACPFGLSKCTKDPAEDAGQKRVKRVVMGGGASKKAGTSVAGTSAASALMDTKRPAGYAPAGSAAKAVLWRRGGAASKYRVVEQRPSERISPKGGFVLLEDQNLGSDMPLCREIDADIQRDLQGAGSSRKLPVKPPQISTGSDETAPNSTRESSADAGAATGSWDECLRGKHPEWSAAFDLCATGSGEKARLSGDAVRRALRRAVPDVSDREVRVVLGDGDEVGELTFSRFCRLAAALAGSGSPSGTAYSIQGLEKAREESQALRKKARAEIARGIAKQGSKRKIDTDQESTPSEGPTEIMQQAEDLLACDTHSEGPTEIVNQAEVLLMECHADAAASNDATDLLLAAEKELAAQMEMFQETPAEVMVVHPGVDEPPATSNDAEEEEEELAYAPYDLPDLPNLPAHLREPVPTERPVTAESYAEAADMMTRLRKSVLQAARIGTLGRALAVLHLVHPRQWECEKAHGLESIAEEDRETAAEAADAVLEGAVMAGSIDQTEGDTSLIAPDASLIEEDPPQNPTVPPLALSGGNAANISSGTEMMHSARSTKSSARRTPRVGPPPPLPPFKPPADYAVTATPRDRSARGPTPRTNATASAPVAPPLPPPLPVAVLKQGTPRKQTPPTSSEHAEWAASSQSRWSSVLDTEDPAALLSARRISAGTPRAELKASLQHAETAESPAIAGGA